MTALFAGLSTVDIAYLVDEFPVQDSKVRALDQFTGAGGPAANAAVTFAHLSGLRPTLITALGRHHLSGIVRDDLRRHGVHAVDAIDDEDCPLPISSVIVVRGSATRTLVSLDATVVRAPMRPRYADELAGASIVLVDGHFADLSLGVARRARELGVPVVLDAGRWRPDHADLLPLVDIAICAASYAPPGARDTVEHLHRTGVGRVAITGGAGPIRYSAPEGHGSIDVPAVVAVDTLGAGDILHGAFCHFFGVRRLAFPDALAAAARTASDSCRVLGTRAWMRNQSGDM